jgi:hypothetical protein
MTSKIRMEEIVIGDLALKGSRIALGTWAMGGWMWAGSDESDSIRTIQRRNRPPGEKGIDSHGGGEMKPWIIWDIERREHERENIDNRLPLYIEPPVPPPDEKREKETEFVIEF